jgi:hypothetical protein
MSTLPSGLFHSGFPKNDPLYAFLSPLMQATCPTCMILPDLIILIFGEKYRL